VAAWLDPEWQLEAHAWIGAQLDRLGLEQSGPIEQPHVRAWATALRVPTTSGAVWFKASIPVLAHEVAVVDVISRRRPDLVPELLASDFERGWMLMADGGVRLRELVESDHDVARWLDVLPRYAELQISLAATADELVAAGAPDRRLAVLPSQYEELLRRRPAEFAGTARGVAELCAQLAAIGVPETIQHDDLHDGQVFVQDGRYLFFDWGDACVSHPFFSLSVTLEGFLSWGPDDVEDSVDVRPFRDAYLEPFTQFAALADLEAAAAAATRLGWVCRALNVERQGRALEPVDGGEMLAGVPLRLRLAFGG